MGRGTEGSFRGAGNILYFDWGGDYTSEFTLFKKKKIVLYINYLCIFMNIYEYLK